MPVDTAQLIRKAQAGWRQNEKHFSVNHAELFVDYAICGYGDFNAMLVLA